MNNCRGNCRRIFIICLWAGVIIFAGFGCAGYIMPRPNFYWPDMAKSKIAGKGAIVIDRAILTNEIITGDEFEPSFKTKVLVGKGMRNLFADVVKTVFENSAIYENEPKPSDMKKIRCLIRIDSVFCLILPESSADRKSPAVGCKLTISGRFEKLADLATKRREFVISGSSSVAYSGTTRQAQKAIKSAVSDGLSDLGHKLAAEIVNTYGARLQ